MNKSNKLFLAVMLGVMALSMSSPIQIIPTALAACDSADAGPSSGFCTRTCPSGNVTYSDSGPRAACPVTSTSDFFKILDRIFTVGASVVGIIAALFILVAALTYITSHGDEEKIGKAKNTIVYAVIGIIVAALAYGVPVVIRTLLGLG